MIVYGVAKDKSLAGRLECFNCSISKPAILSLAYESSFLFGLFMIFH